MTEEYRQYLMHLDKILTSLNGNQNYESLSSILSQNKIKPDDRDSQFKIAEKLEQDGLTRVFRDTVSVNIEITARGIEFISKGGYIGHLNRQLEKDNQDKDLAESTINSNKANVKYFRWNIGFAIFNMVLGIVNLIIFYLSLKK